MHSLKAFIRENHCQKIAPCSTAIFPYFTALTERKLLLRLTECHIKRDVFTDPLFGQDFSPYSCRGWEAIAAEFTALDFQWSAANILTKASNKIPAGCDKTQDGTDPPWESIHLSSQGPAPWTKEGAGIHPQSLALLQRALWLPEDEDHSSGALHAWFAGHFREHQ